MGIKYTHTLRQKHFLSQQKAKKRKYNYKPLTKTLTYTIFYQLDFEIMTYLYTYIATYLLTQVVQCNGVIWMST